MAEALTKYATGAVRSGTKPRYRDIPTCLLRRIGLAFSEGAEKYEVDLAPYEKNWESGDLRFAFDAFDHAIEHLLEYRDQVRRRLLGLPLKDGEDHLGHLGANIAMLAQFEEWEYWNPGTWEAVPEPTEEEIEQTATLLPEEPAEEKGRIMKLLTGIWDRTPPPEAA